MKKLKYQPRVISKAVQDSNIPEKDYAFINQELNRYNRLNEEIRKKIERQLIYFERKILIEYGYKKGVDEFIKKISNS